MWLFGRSKLRLPAPEEALPGRDQPIAVADRHTVLGTPLAPPYPDGTEVAEFALGCFWGAERRPSAPARVEHSTAREAGGHTPEPAPHTVCARDPPQPAAGRAVLAPRLVAPPALPMNLLW